MKLQMSADAMRGILAFADQNPDCEKLSESECVMDLYDLEPPVSLDLVFEKDGISVDGAVYLQYDEEMNGWYMGDPLPDAQSILTALKACGALAA